jgi:hypothetical protein
MGEYFLDILRDLIPGLDWSIGVSYIHTFVLVGRRDGHQERNFAVNIRSDILIVKELIQGGSPDSFYTADIGDHASVKSAFYRAAGY